MCAQTVLESGGTERFPSRMSSSKSVLMTGATRGLGLECCSALVEAGHHVTALVRSGESAERLRERLDSDSIELVICDLRSLASVRRAAASAANAARRRRRDYDAIICSAGTQSFGARDFSADRIEMTFAVNHVAHQLLVEALFSTVSEDGRVVVVSSGTHDPDALEGRSHPPAEIVVSELADGTEGGQELSAMRRYSTSKLCNLLLVRHLDDLRAHRAGPSVVGFDPGAVPSTGLTRHWPWWLRTLSRGAWLLRPFGVAVSTPRAAGQALAEVAVGRGPYRSGRYYQLGSERKPSATARDSETARRLVSETRCLIDARTPTGDAD